MSFAPFKFKELVKETNFEDSELYKEVSNKFLFIVFQEQKMGIMYIKEQNFGICQIQI